MLLLLHSHLFEDSDSLIKSPVPSGAYLESRSEGTEISIEDRVVGRGSWLRAGHIAYVLSCGRGRGDKSDSETFMDIQSGGLRLPKEEVHNLSNRASVEVYPQFQ